MMFLLFVVLNLTGFQKNIPKLFELSCNFSGVNLLSEKKSFNIGTQWKPKVSWCRSKGRYFEAYKNDLKRLCFPIEVNKEIVQVKQNQGC